VSSRLSSGPGWAGVVTTLIGIAVAAALVLAVPELRHAASAAIHGDTAAMRSEIDQLGASGALVVFAMALIHAVVFYPAEILNTAAGYAYGFAIALPLVMAAWMASAVVGYGIGHAAARPVLYKLAGEERMRGGERLISRGGAPLLLGIRLFPLMPFSVVCYVCGAARVPFGRYMWTTLVGYLPITAVFVYFGSRLDTLSPTDPWLLASLVVIVALLAVAWWLGPKLNSSGTEPT
jgi:uncharacterized membrane protein YdjX (TVP38/TMEM64 family)